MQLNHDDTSLTENPSRAKVLKTIAELSVEEFVILSRDDDHYVQTRCNDDQTWCLEYRDGSAERHFGTDPEATTREMASKAFSAYYDGLDLAPLLSWQFVDTSPSELDDDEE